jgi:TrmH family RNA methyltransferase
VARIRIVLVRPVHAANVGACARLVRNSGAEGLDLVRPGEWRTVECWRTAWGAQEVLEAARVFDELAEAVSASSLVVGFTRRRSAGSPLADVRDTAAALAGLGEAEAASLVFGPETGGLTNEELALCGRAATIPAHPAHPSYNLSHAVAIVAYELHRASRRSGDEAPRRASHEEKERLLSSLSQGLLAIGALPVANPVGALGEWRALLQRADLTPKEVALLEHAARKMQRARRG